MAFLRDAVRPGSAITLKDGAVEQSNFGDYTVARISDKPEFDVHILPSAEPPTGCANPACHDRHQRSPMPSLG
jgi:CO/xanthine dehydrogenase Mo-binding subunit